MELIWNDKEYALIPQTTTSVYCKTVKYKCNLLRFTFTCWKRYIPFVVSITNNISTSFKTVAHITGEPNCRPKFAGIVVATEMKGNPYISRVWPLTRTYQKNVSINCYVCNLPIDGTKYSLAENRHFLFVLSVKIVRSFTHTQNKYCHICHVLFSNIINI